MIRSEDLIAIINLKGATDRNFINRRFLKQLQEEGEIIDISDEQEKNAKSLIVTVNQRVYISPISAHTLCKRVQKFGLLEGMKTID
ncbi:MAG: DUF370 domain-containing protein [Veillonellaceae bacterium]|nr:DUF370 domain-containing protein [Veillonellaceae bacterium]